MTVNKALETINEHIQFMLLEYEATDESQDSEGNYVAHPVESLTDEQKLFTVDQALKNVAIETVPLKLVETDGSAASEYRRISSKQYIRVPSTPVKGDELDIDESLAYAVIYKSTSMMHSDFRDMDKAASNIIMAYNESYLDQTLDSQTEVHTEKVLFRFSPDGVDNWTDSFKSGDKYISFKNGDTWSEAVKFVGSDGADGSAGGDGSFTGLSDTPASLTAGKMFKVNAAGDAIVEVDPPSGDSSQDGISGSWGVSGTVQIDLMESTSNKNHHYYALSGHTDFEFPTHTDENGDTYKNVEMGRDYTLYIYPQGNTATIDFAGSDGATVHGDSTIDETKTVVVITFFYDGVDLIIKQNIGY